MQTRPGAVVLAMAGLSLLTLACSDRTSSQAQGQAQPAASLQIDHITEGTGASPTATSRLTVNPSVAIGVKIPLPSLL